MTKREFIAELRLKLAGLPKSEIEERLSFYSEIIDDKIEDGKAEEIAVSEVGSVEDIANQIIDDMPFTRLAVEKFKPQRKLKAWEIILISVGSVVWLPLLIALFAVIFSVYAVIWSLVVALWAVEVSFMACAPVGVISGVAFIFRGFVASGFATIGLSVLLAGLSIFLFYGCVQATKGTAILAKKIALSIKKSFMKKEVA